MTILETLPAQSLKLDLEFIKPFPDRSLTLFPISPAGAGSKVEWSMSGKLNRIGKRMCLVMGNMEKSIGPDFERGLAQRKAAAQKQ